MATTEAPAMRAMTPDGLLVLPASAPRDDWLAARRHGITATDLVKILGLSPYGNALDVYLDKRVGGSDQTPQEAARWGQLLEDEVAKEWGRRQGATVRRVGLLRHRDHPHHLASLDRTVAGQASALEVKTISAFVASDWEDGVPDKVIAQTQWQMAVTGFRKAHIATLVGGQRLESFTVWRDDDVVAYLREEADRVWAAVEAGEPPDVPASQLTVGSLNRLYPDRTGSVDLPDEAAEWLAQYRAAAAAEKDAAALKDEAKLGLLSLLGSAEEGLIGGVPVITYRAGRPTRSIAVADLAHVAGALNDLVAQYAAEKPGTRTFRITKEA